jgi:hypothetical protein
VVSPRTLVGHDLNLGEVEFYFVDVAPAPIFAGLDGFDDGVLGGVEMFCGVFVFRRVAATDVAAGHAKAKMDPSVAHLHAFGAYVRFGFEVFIDLLEVFACGHFPLLRWRWLCSMLIAASIEDGDLKVAAT